MPTHNIHAAKSQLSRLIEAVERGEEVIIARAGKPVARLAPMAPAQPPRRRGVLKGELPVGPEFDEPLPDGLLAQFEGHE